eukprot:1423250-Rhodomonas_salina.2
MPEGGEQEYYTEVSRERGEVRREDNKGEAGGHSRAFWGDEGVRGRRRGTSGEMRGDALQFREHWILSSFFQQEAAATSHSQVCQVRGQQCPQ